jgi:hypothetical protein
MTSKYRSLLILALCVGLTCGLTNVSAQNGGDKVLVAGAAQLRQSDVDAMVEFYEWAIDVKFTAGQRAKFQSLTEADFRNDPVTARKGIEELLDMRAKVEAMDEKRRREVRGNFIGEFIKGLRQHTEDEATRLLLSIYDASRDGAGTSDVAAGDLGGEAPGPVGDASALAGKWVWARTGGTSWNPNGTYAGGNGSRFTYQFSPNGAVEYTGIMNVMMAGCSQQVFLSKKGRARLSGDTLAIDWAPATSTRDFSCDRANNYTKTLPAETETLKVSFKSSSTGQRQLCTVSNGGETCFSPAE